MLVHLLNMATVSLVVTLLGVEFSISAFVNPAAWQLESEPQLKMLSRCALLAGRVMPIWYSACATMLGFQTWLHWQGSGRGFLLAADATWVLISLVSVFFLVPLNNRVARGAADWQRIHRSWDKVHRVRIAAVALVAILLVDVLLR